jgi:hypothetical protein
MHDGQQLGGDGVKVDLLAQAVTEHVHNALRIVRTTVEALLD